jgi:PAS domain S-box-containing protein
MTQQLIDSLAGVINWRSMPCVLLDAKERLVLCANQAAKASFPSLREADGANWSDAEGRLRGAEASGRRGGTARPKAVRNSTELRFTEDVFYLVDLARDLGDSEEMPFAISDAALQSIVEAHFALWYEWNLSTGACHFPGQLKELLGNDHGQPITCIENWLSLVHPEDLPEVVAENERSIRSCETYRGEYRLRRSDGSYILVSDSGVVLANDNGVAERMVGGIRDVTAERSNEQSLRESAELYEALVSCSLMPIIRVSENGFLLDANAAAATFFEVERQELVGQRVEQLLPDHVVYNIDALLRAGDHSEVLHLSSELGIEVEGNRKTLLSTVVPCVVQGQPSVFVLGADLTERKRMSDALVESEQAVRQYATTIEERNVALRVILEQRQRDREDLEHAVTDNVDSLIMPLLDRLIRSLGGRPELALAESLRMTLDEITRPMLRRQATDESRNSGLSRRESEILQLIHSGHTTAEMSQALHISPATVTFHRGNIRQKLGMHGSPERLASKVTAKTFPLDDQSPEQRPAQDRGPQDQADPHP